MPSGGRASCESVLVYLSQTLPTAAVDGKLVFRFFFPPLVAGKRLARHGAPGDQGERVGFQSHFA